jgi:uncharacterized phage protein (TIGR02216 family)
VNDGFPWRRLMGFGIGRLGMASADFWKLTPRELAAAIEAATGRGEPLARTAFDALAARYPDTKGHP